MSPIHFDKLDWSQKTSVQTRDDAEIDDSLQVQYWNKS